MRKIFNSQYKITQEFGVNADYYKQFGLAGHEGIDIIPSGSVWDIFALEDGVVVLDDDIVGSVSSDPYGKIVTLWHPNVKKATMYCHLAENYVSLGQTVKRGDKIGKMGTTGNSTGPHLHLNLFEVDDQGVRLNRKNGFNGGINPKPFLEESVETAQPVSGDTIPVLKSDFEQLVGKSSEYDKFVAGGFLHLEEVQKTINEKEVTIQNLTKDINACETQVGKMLDDAQKINDSDKNTSSELLDAQHALQPLKDELEATRQELGIFPESSITDAIKALKSSKVKQVSKPVTFLEKLQFLFT